MALQRGTFTVALLQGRSNCGVRAMFQDGRIWLIKQFLRAARDRGELAVVATTVGVKVEQLKAYLDGGIHGLSEIQLERLHGRATVDS